MPPLPPPGPLRSPADVEDSSQDNQDQGHDHRCSLGNDPLVDYLDRRAGYRSNSQLSGAWGSVPEGDKADGPGHGLPVCRYIPFPKAIELIPASGGGRPGGRGCG